MNSCTLSADRVYVLVQFAATVEKIW